ncbi:hypothetical protein [Streptomyces sp. NPDC088816]|uniref:hypothetical protein n=1 Tax=Streptomyces sp. NPDC088816 TaxID=3365906 RepID=UPI0037F5183D
MNETLGGRAGPLKAVEAANRDFNRASVEELCRENDLVYTPRGAVYEIGGARARALFHDRQGQAYVDAVLVAESLDLPPEDWGWVEAWLEARHLPVLSLGRGMHLAMLVELHHLARVLGDVLPEPADVRQVRASWVRTWSTPATQTDTEALAVQQGL